MAKALVVGGVGFVGVEIVRQLIEKGDEVCIFDSHGSHAITRGNAPAFMVKTKTLEHAAELLAFDILAFCLCCRPTSRLTD